MGRLRKVFSLSSIEIKLFIEACILLTISNLGVKFVPFRYIERLMHSHWYIGAQQPDVSLDDFKIEIEVIRSSLSRAVNALPWKSWCLSRSIAAFVMFRRRHVPAIMFTGVKFEGSSFRAHAWVHAGHEPAAEARENVAFTPLIRIVARPQPLTRVKAPSYRARTGKHNQLS